MQDDEIFDLLSIESVNEQLSRWEQTKTLREANEIKANQGKKSVYKKNTEIKPLEIEAGTDNAKDKLHPQRFLMRTPVVSPDNYWDLFPVKWPETYYTVYLEDVGLEDQLGQKQLELLHDRRSPIRVKMFSALNANIGRSLGFKTQNLRQLEDGTTDLVTKDDWAKIATVNDLMLSLDNLVAAYAKIWPGDCTVVTIRRVVTKHKEFANISPPEVRLRLLESFIDRMLDINQGKAAQGTPGLKFKEVNDWAKEFSSNKDQYIKSDMPRWPAENTLDSIKSLIAKAGSNSGPKKDRAPHNKGGGRDFSMEFMKKNLMGKKVNGKDVCLMFNSREGCRHGSSCRMAHVCGYIPRGEREPCGKDHKKADHKRN